MAKRHKKTTGIILLLAFILILSFVLKLPVKALKEINGELGPGPFGLTCYCPPEHPSNCKCWIPEQ